MPPARRLLSAAPLLAATLVVGCASVRVPHVGKGQIAAVGAENEYANVISQIGGRYVAVAAIESNPNTDPHSFQASPEIAHLVSSAKLVVQNGLGYDTFMNRIEDASPSTTRKVIDVQALLGLPDSTTNPHLWYSPRTMPAVARALLTDLTQLQPAHARYFAANERHFVAALEPWFRGLRQFAARYPQTQVATTEPVGDYMLAAAGLRTLTPSGFETDVMNGVDPAPQDITLVQNLLSHRRVKLFVYNQQVTDSLTESLLSLAKRHGVPVVGAYETMPAGYDYQAWMLAELAALQRAVANGASTEHLP